MKPVVVLATDSREPSGLGAHMITLGAELAGQFDIIVACQNDEAGVHFLRQAARRKLRIKAFDPAQMEQFRDWLVACGAKLLHVHAGIGWEGHDLVRYGKAAGVPVVRTEHLPYLLTSVVQQAEYRAMLKSVDSRIAVSSAAFASSAGQGNGQHNVVRNGIVPGKPTRSAAETRAELGLAPGEKLALTVARFTAQKGHDVLVAAAKTVLDSQRDVKFVLVGTGPEQDAIAEAVTAAGLGDNVILTGRRDDVADLMAAADLFVLPSHFEGLPLAVLEAMAAGVPVVATAVSGTLEAVGKDHPFLVPAGDANALAQSILQALADPDAARAVATQAQERFAEQFTAQRMASETAAVYAPLLTQEFEKGPLA